jgi:hypothetical protein
MATFPTTSSRELDSKMGDITSHYVGPHTGLETVLIISRLCIASNLLSAKIMRVTLTANFRLATLCKAWRNELLRKSSLLITA